MERLPEIEGPLGTLTLRRESAAPLGVTGRP